MHHEPQAMKDSQMDRKGLTVFTGEMGISLLIATLFLSLVTGLHIISPHETAWLTNGGDLEQQYLGWEFFRREPHFQFPLGKLNGLGLGLTKSIVFTDSAPIIAIPAKWLMAGMKSPIQVTGIWILMSTSLMHFFGKECLKSLGTQSIYANILATSIMASPTFLNRLNGNHGIAAHLGQWLILAAIALSTAGNKKKRPWITLLAVSLLTNIYLFAMVLAISLSSDSSRKACLNKACLTSLAISALAAGYFDISNLFKPSGYASQGAYGTFKWNTLSMFNPDPQWSGLIPNIWEVNNGEYEGFSYLGLIVFSGILSAGIILIKGKLTVLLGSLSRIRQLITPTIVMALFAMTLSIGIGPMELSIAGLPWPLSIIGNTFRASGRFIWPLYYLITISSLYSLYQLVSHNSKREPTIAVLLLAVILSTADMSSSLARIRRAHSPSGRVQLNNYVNKDLKNKNIDRIVLENTKNSPKRWPELLKLALAKKASINTGYFARYEEQAVTKHNAATAQMLIEASFHPRELILISRDREKIYNLLHDYKPCSESTRNEACRTETSGYLAIYTGDGA